MTRFLSTIAAALVLAALPSAAFGSASQESMFQDDPLLVYGSQAQVDDTLDQLAAMGVDRIRVSVFWQVVAPANTQVSKPDFDATNPAAYPAQNWARYDRVLRSALARGIRVNFNITSPVPRWAASEAPASRKDLQETWGPNASEFEQFVAAVGKRYSGLDQGLPRVDYWSVWNEPNQAGWLTPQWAPDPRDARRQVEAAPATYRALLAAAWRGLASSGHGADTILVGETAPQGTGDRQGLTGSIDALRFLRQLYCLDDNLNVLKGTDAQVRACPDGDPARFVTENPALFRATGYAHHPYELLSPPGRRAKPVDWATMANLGDLSRELRRIYARYGQKTQTPRGVPLYLTEYGYQTAPDPFFKAVTFARQAAWLNEAEYIARRNPNVRVLSQFLLVDDRPDPKYSTRKQPNLAWRTFQSGLTLLTGKRKPSYNAYITPLHVAQSRVRSGRPVSLFGLLRAARPGSSPRVALQWRPLRSTRWRTRRTIRVAPRRAFTARLTVPRTGFVRLRWVKGAKAFASRGARVTVGPVS